jgi:molecular chaperone HscB
MPTPEKQTDQAVLAKCTACQGPMQSPAFCDHCRSLYPTDSLNHFELLGLDPTYDLDAGALRQRYLAVSRGVHPDQHGGGGATLSLRLSAQLNEAHRVLTDPVLRAEYLLELHGGKSAAEDKQVPQDVLSQTLLLREEIADAKTAGHQDTLDACARQVHTAHDTVVARVAKLARALPGDEPLRNDLRSALNTVKYYQRLLKELD